MMMLLAASFGMVACFAVGALTQFWPTATEAAHENGEDKGFPNACHGMARTC